MRRPIDFVNASMKAKLGGEPVLSVVEACHAVEAAVREALEEAAAVADIHGNYWTEEEIRRLADSPVSGGANYG